jgi:hypothetical protein
MNAYTQLRQIWRAQRLHGAAIKTYQQLDSQISDLYWTLLDVNAREATDLSARNSLLQEHLEDIYRGLLLLEKFI